MTTSPDGIQDSGTVLVGTFNEPGELAPPLPASAGMVLTRGWAGSPEVLAGTGPDAPSWLVPGRAGTPSEGRLYAALHLSEGQLAVLSPSSPAAGDGVPQDPRYDVGWVTSQLVATGGSETCHADLNPSGTWLAAASYGSGTLTVVPVLADGRLGQPVAATAPGGSGPVSARQQEPHLHFVLFLDDDRLLVTDLGADRILEYSIRELTDGPGAAGHGQPAFVHTLPPGTGPRHLAVLPPLPEAGIVERHLAVVGELDSRLHLLDLDSTPEGFREVAVVPTCGQDQDPESALENLPSHLVLSPDASLVYVANRGRNTIGVIRRSGTPELIAEVPCGGDWPRHIALGHAGGAPTLFVALERGDAVVGLPLDADGIPTEARTRVTVRRPGFLLPNL
ncbi:lactonase family protein [Microbacterium sp. A93]|uniref:lactonase family protein n=1 Tax=Microbacterium sp. A93 TaxID=3450716 RepID=UPI003F441A50